MVYYNDNDARAAAWLRELIEHGHLPEGVVDDRSITDVRPEDLTGYHQCHFFAGIGGWPYALSLAGWGDAPVWTGSCPCQPFSGAGRGKGHADERHLWPAFHALISECHPPVVFGEQVASKLGREWLAGVRADMEALGYACGAADLCAASVGAPHIRQRLYWVADANGERPQGWIERRDGAEQRSAWEGGVGIQCRDGTTRRAEPGIRPLADGVSGRMGLLRGYGNAIVPQVAAEFVQAYREAVTQVWR
jgi:DNA (cytosine-5)-methyltransferase 1